MMFKRFFNWVVGLPLVVLAIVFAVANRQWVTVSLDPLHHDAPLLSIAMPMWVLFFCGVFAGIFAGWSAAWFAHRKWHRAAREARIELLRTQTEHERWKRAQPSRTVAVTEDALH
jgi:uncharacterized integral membrane protein